MAMIVIAMLCAVSAMDVEHPAFFAANDELRDYILEALENNPGLQARHVQWLAALEKVPQVTSLDDPMFTYGVFVQSATGRYKLALMQKFPWFGTLRARGNKAMAEADASLSRFHAGRNRLIAGIKRVYFEYAFLGESIKVTRSQAEILVYMEDIVRLKYSLGLAREDALLRVQVARDKLEDRHQTLKAQRPALSAMLSEALGREGMEPIAWPQLAQLPPPAPSMAVIQARVRQANPELMAVQHMIDGRGQMIELARKKGLPDFTLGIEYVSLGAPELNRPDRPYPSALAGANRLGKWITQGVQPGPGTALIDLYSLAASSEPMAYPDDLQDNLMVSVTVNLPVWRKRIRQELQRPD